MLITLKNKDTLIVGSFTFKCCIGKNGVKTKKFEGDLSTPKGLFSLGKIYYRSDRVKKPNTRLSSKKITKNIGWCNDVKSKFYNSEIKIDKKIKHEKLFKKSKIYDYFIVIKHNAKKIPYKGSAIFLHLTNTYKPTAGCIALKKKDFLIFIKIINRKTKIKIN
jgi:L,D-peptidoglycan transpeptidase YkuD (ErfK/YbiS/YcfS/YnhG family)|tara:strand:- start:1015 stop:1503 length:489 start_codon:yes stop_codon:yes gene_type:complete